ncbi:DcaP family trimeric outer membrane transporter [Inmirania thermothiophila]|uniref:DcaP family trimeric outer membrane transporter n=1 Tax=Inmirania thermothiophila TaxID=1750597 RepID=UPI000F465CD2|nr:DcaP family trimeric outer membrane transporter [Inmirania thermothiophila]
MTRGSRSFVATASAAGTLAAALAAAPAAAVEFQVPGTSTKLDLGGYVKLDIIYNDVTAGEDSQANIEFTPSAIPIDGKEEGTDQIQFNGRESRVWIKTSTPTDKGPLNSHLEFDFDTAEGNQVVSNSRGARIRHAYFTWNNILMGRTWSTVMILPALPETNDFGGPAGDSFVRQGQVRLTFPFEGGSFQLAFENPESFLFDASGGSFMVVDDDQIPDIIGRVNQLEPRLGHRLGAGRLPAAA